MLVIANLLAARGVPPVGMPAGDFVKHLHKVHVYARVAFDELPEFLEGRCERLLGVRVNVAGDVGEVLAMDAVVGGEPCARPA